MWPVFCSSQLEAIDAGTCCVFTSTTTVYVLRDFSSPSLNISFPFGMGPVTYVTGFWGIRTASQHWSLVLKLSACCVILMHSRVRTPVVLSLDVIEDSTERLQPDGFGRLSSWQRRLQAGAALLTFWPGGEESGIWKVQSAKGKSTLTVDLWLLIVEYKSPFYMVWMLLWYGNSCESCLLALLSATITPYWKS